MNSDLDDLYQQVILDHSKRPRNFRELPHATHQAEGYNALCGDRITLFLTMPADTVAEVAFQGSGCAICTASASLMTDRLKGMLRDESESLFQAFHDLLTGKSIDDDTMKRLGKLAALAGVQRFPMRVKCATLPWHTFKAALEHSQQPVSTE